MSAPVFEASGLCKTYALRGSLLAALGAATRPVLRAVDGVDLRVESGEILALVGESGSGKTTTGKLVTLQERPTAGVMRFAGADIGTLKGPALKAYRRQVQMIFQNPYEALDPRHRIITSVMEPLAVHAIEDAPSRRDAALQMLEQVGLSPAWQFAERYPADLSGGQLQRVAIARALVLQPKLVVADEPVSMLDVSVRAGVMAQMLALSREMALASLYITHDLAVARVMSSRIAVMYLGAIIEEGPTESLISGAAHPYTRLLVAAVPEYRSGVKRERIRLAGEASSLPPLARGCRFAARCPRATELCRMQAPARVEIGPGHWSACHYAEAVRRD